MTDDTTKALLRATADWIGEAIEQASDEGQALVGECLQRDTGDLSLVVQLKRGEASLYAAAVGVAPTLIVSAHVPALESAEVINFPAQSEKKDLH